MNEKRTRAPTTLPIPETSSHHKNQTKNKPLRAAQSIDLQTENLEIIKEEDDIFINQSLKAEEIDGIKTNQLNETNQQSSLSFVKLALSSFAFLFTLAVGLWIDGLISELFTRANWLGWLGTGVAIFLLFGLTGLILRELLSIFRLRSLSRLRAELTFVKNELTQVTAQRFVQRVASIVSDCPETARGRHVLLALKGEIIDGADLIKLAEIELLKPLDQKAKTLILASASRVSIVTSLSPRALIDTGYVLFEMVRLARKIAQLYGCRPRFFGSLRLLRNITTHLALTGTMSLGDGMIEQMVGQGLIAKISTRFGEGLVNGLMTTRFGIVAMEVSRPMPFKELSKPKMRDFLQELNGFKNNKKPK